MTRQATGVSLYPLTIAKAMSDSREKLVRVGGLTPRSLLLVHGCSYR